MAKLNRRNVINLIRKSGPINKAQIAKKTGLSIPTVMKITDEFMDRNLVYVSGKGESNGGKRPEMLEINKNAFHIIGIDIGRSKIKVIIMNLSGEIIEKRCIHTGTTIPEWKLIERLIVLIEEVIVQSGIMSDNILGMGIGMPGLLENETGRVLFSPDFQWENVDIVEPIRKYFDMNICIENSNRALAMGEYWFGRGSETDYMICVSIGHGIGSAIIENGDFYRGACGSSGEVGHITLNPDGPQCDCGNRGCLEALASGNAIALEAVQMIQDGAKTKILELVENDPKKIDAKIVFDAAKEGDQLAMDIVEKAIDYIGIGLASYINLLDPKLIVLAGGVTESGDYFINRVKKVVRKRQMKFAGRKVKIRLAEPEAYAAAVGAASLILKKFIENGGVIEE